jgi:hypothetical protein
MRTTNRSRRGPEGGEPARREGQRTRETTRRLRRGRTPRGGGLTLENWTSHEAVLTVGFCPKSTRPLPAAPDPHVRLLAPVEWEKRALVVVKAAFDLVDESWVAAPASPRDASGFATAVAGAPVASVLLPCQPRRHGGAACLEGELELEVPELEVPELEAALEYSFRGERLLLPVLVDTLVARPGEGRLIVVGRVCVAVDAGPEAAARRLRLLALRVEVS